MDEQIVELLKFLLPLLTAALAWLFNEQVKREAEEYTRREKQYEALIEALEGFYVHVAAEQQRARDMKAQFLRELDKTWLYCPDEIIVKAYAFLALVHTDRKASDEDKERAVGELILEIRRDLLLRKVVKKTKLTPSHFKHLRVT